MRKKGRRQWRRGVRRERGRKAREREAKNNHIRFPKHWHDSEAFFVEKFSKFPFHRWKFYLLHH